MLECDSGKNIDLVS